MDLDLDNIDVPKTVEHQEIQFRQELMELINRHSRENKSNTPDFILAQYLLDCLSSFDKAVKHRAYWHGHEKQNLEYCQPPESK